MRAGLLRVQVAGISRLRLATRRVRVEVSKRIAEAQRRREKVCLLSSGAGVGGRLQVTSESAQQVDRL